LVNNTNNVVLATSHETQFCSRLQWFAFSHGYIVNSAYLPSICTNEGTIVLRVIAQFFVHKNKINFNFFFNFLKKWIVLQADPREPMNLCSFQQGMWYWAMDHWKWWEFWWGPHIMQLWGRHLIDHGEYKNFSSF